MTDDRTAGLGTDGSRGGELKRKAIWAGIALIGALIIWIVGAYVMPRWWAQRLGDIVDERLTVGSVTGVVIGSVFTLLPLVVLWAGVRFRRSWKRALVFVAAALILFAPVGIIGTIVWGDGSAAHAGERILDVRAPGVRGGALVGVIIGVVAFIGLVYLGVSRRLNKRRARRYKAELRDHEGVRQPGS
jgi:hypothetical protein